MTRDSPRLLLVLVVTVATIAGGGLATADGTTDSMVDHESDQSACSFPLSVQDTTGAEITIEDRPARIVALQPSDAQILWEIGADDRVVGMPQGPTTGYLNDTDGITNIKNADGTVDVETVTNLSADVVLAANVTKSGTIDQLRSTGTTVYHFGEVQSMEETYRNVNRTGQIVGSCGAAADRVAAMQERLDRIQQAVADRDEPRVLYLFYGYTAGDDTHINSMIEIAGGENVAASAGLTSYQPISEEVVVVNDPQWIVQPSDAPPAAGAPYNDTTALQQGQVLQVNTNYANQAGPRVVNVVERMAQSFHPAAFDENGDPIVDRTQTEAPSSTETPMDSTTTDTPTPQTTTTAADGPGFSGLIALVGLLGAIVFLGVRRKGV